MLVGRNANGQSSIYENAEGWHGRVTVGGKDDGRPDRRHVRGRTKAEVTQKVRKLEKLRDAGRVPEVGQRWTVEKWLTHWLENIAKPSVRYKTYVGYRTAVQKHLIPGVGAHRLDLLEPEHLEKLYARILASGLKAGTAHQVHRTARTAIGEAFKRRRIAQNPAELAKPPRVDEEEIEPFEAEDIDRLIQTALAKRNGVRFVVALALGIRQGEALGLKWSRLDEGSKTFQIRKSIQRRTWQHGCDDPHACGARYHKTIPCKEGCKRHQRACPPPCPASCTSHARWCPERHSREVEGRPPRHRRARRVVQLAHGPSPAAGLRAGARRDRVARGRLDIRSAQR